MHEISKIPSLTQSLTQDVTASRSYSLLRKLREHVSSLQNLMLIFFAHWIKREKKTCWQNWSPPPFPFLSADDDMSTITGQQKCLFGFALWLLTTSSWDIWIQNCISHDRNSLMMFHDYCSKNTLVFLAKKYTRSERSADASHAASVTDL